MNNHSSPQQLDQSERPAGRPRRPGLLRRAALVATCLAGAGTLMLLASGTAFATVDQTSQQWAELGPDAYTGGQTSQVTAVYTIQNVAESGTEMLEDNGNNMNSGGTVDVWSQIYQTTNQDPNWPDDVSMDITQANYLWEYVPDDPSDGESIVDGPGELINRQSGLCLDVANNNTSDGAAIDQWACNGGSNQQWTALDLAGHFMLQPMLDQGTGFLGVGNGSTCTTSGDGDSVYVRTTGTAGNPCDEWTIQQASYDFGTYPLTVQKGEVGGGNTDNRSYECVPSDKFRGPSIGWDWATASDAGVDVSEDAGVPGGSTGEVPGGVFWYYTVSGDGLIGQVILYCDPQQTGP
jgi:hypothetical protein